MTLTPAQDSAGRSSEPLTMTVKQALLGARTTGVERLDAHLLLAWVIGQSRTWLLANDDMPLTPAQSSAYLTMLTRRAGGEPLAYILGEKEFHGLSLHVNPHVLVPRPDTETLVDWGLDLLRTAWPEVAAPRVIDLGTGSGAVALAIKAACPAAEVTAVDTSLTALQVAQRNAHRLGQTVRCLHSDWWSSLIGARFHLALANPPYIAEGDSHLSELSHEPRAALVSGSDGLDAIRQIIRTAHAHLEPGAWLLIEHGHDQAESVRRLLGSSHFSHVQSRTDLSGVERCSGGCVDPQ